ncbi:bifunctional folylpolyglutamate synthase/dihydrofolate synthase [Tautonia sociabilis]|uniref:Dihydrofolate synthase/folylpolyglutamate synthase n=1 Tax=Tautonia sociabilis TaxID=2080755 RepID=A0A432MG23_9BACT|nr:Mur ligase family protein [Tautonia sociabilis]RUL85531.1 bifunctional folylpolyglutamate synthase/dihydrofolate synthase [Tautonia sociabilis]
MTTDSYRNALDALYARLDYERLGMPAACSSTELRLGRMRRLLRRLGDPQDAFRIVHVAGTKGKGSTSAMVAAALTASGFRAGLFTSPHLHRLEERFVVDGAMMTPDELIARCDELRPAIEAVETDWPGPDGRGLTFFEVTTALGLLHFARSGCRAVALEVGMGGRLDSTNVVRPAVSVLTTISFDHVRQLGPTLGHIAREKAGILKRGTPAVVGVRQPEPISVIREVARSRRCPLFELGTDFEAFYEPPRPPIDRPSNGSVLVRTWRRDWGPISAPLPGAHQAANAAVALAALDALADIDPTLEVLPEHAARGFATLRWPARVEVVGEAPWLVIDGAHNVASAEALAASLRSNFPEVPRSLVFGTSRDKDLAGQLRALLPLFDTVIATRYVENPRAVAPDAIAEAVAELGGPTAMIAPEPTLALDLARRATPESGLICVTGSLFLAAEARAAALGLTNIPARPRLVT